MTQKHISPGRRLAIINAKVIDPKINEKMASLRFKVSKKQIRKIWNSVDLKKLTEEMWGDFVDHIDDEY